MMWKATRITQKIKRPHATDLSKYEHWIVDILFAIYAWNASPIYITDKIIYFASIRGTLKFPFDILENIP